MNRNYLFKRICRVLNDDKGVGIFSSSHGADGFQRIETKDDPG